MTVWFLDTGFVIALASTRDRFHEIARRLADQIELEGTHLVTSQAVVLEIGAALSRKAFRAAAVRLIDAIQSDPSIEVVPITENLLTRAFEVFRTHTDKDWSLTDCVSFEIMRERAIREALTPDSHFHQAGFAALLRSE